MGQKSFFNKRVTMHENIQFSYKVAFGEKQIKIMDMLREIFSMFFANPETIQTSTILTRLAISINIIKCILRWLHSGPLFSRILKSSLLKKKSN